jgi:hypothetical protein
MPMEILNRTLVGRSFTHLHSAVFAVLAIYGLRWLGARAVFSPAVSALHRQPPNGRSRKYDSFGLFGVVLLLRLLKRQTARADVGLAFIIGLLVLAAASPRSTGVGLRDLARIFVVGSAASLAASETKKSNLSVS